MKPRFFLSKSIATLLATSVCLAGSLHALPKGGHVASGSASFSQAGAVLNIRAGDRSIIDYSSFNIARGEKVIFLQPGSDSIVLNRVLDVNPTYIFGTIEANGRIALANPYGIFFENGSVLNVAGIVAGAGHISQSDFLAGRINFTSLTGDVTNRGTIIAINDVGLYGAHVSNEGLITSEKGSVTMGAGSSVYVGEAGGNIFVGAAPAIPKARVVSKPGVSNSGSISAPTAMLVAGDMYGVAIAQSGNITGSNISLAGGKGGSVNVSGRVDASNRTPGGKGGKIKFTGSTIALRDVTVDASGDAGGGTVILEGGHDAVTPTTVTSSGTILARGEGSGSKGGTVQLLGDHVGLFDKAVVDVSGDAGGGTTLVGGDYQGTGTVQRALATYMSVDSIVTADAINRGDGGKAIFWSDGFTNVHGTIYARGGGQSGDGGLVETSGHEYLDARGVRGGAYALNGKAGLWMFDPDSNVAITGAASSNGLFILSTWTPTADNSNILNTAINALLTGGTTVTVTTTNALGTQAGNITVSAPITASGAGTLSLTAGTGGGAGGVIVNQPISSNGVLPLNVNLSSALGSVTFGLTGSLATNGGNVLITAGTTATLGNITTGAGTLGVTAGGAITQNAATSITIGGTSSFNAGANPVTLTQAGNNFTGAVSANNTGANAIQLTDTNAIVLGTVNTANNLTVSAVGITQNAGGLTVGGTSLFNGGAGVITLTTAGNDFTGAVSANNTGANAIQLTDTNAIVLGTVNTANNLTVSAVGITQNAGGLTVGGTSLFNGGAGVITLTTAGNNFTGAVSANNTGANAIQLTDTNAIVLGTVNTADNLTVNAVGITQNAGGLTVGGTSLFNGGAGVITLTTAGNDFTGAVSANNTGANAIQLTDTNAIVLGTVNTANNLTVSAVGITQNAGGLTVGGTSLFNAGAGVITLTTATNDFTGAVSLNNSGANNVAVADANAIVIGASTVGQNLAVTAKGSISQTGALVVPGTSSFTVDTALLQDVLLAGFDNNFTGAVTIATTGGATLQDVGLRNINGAAAVPALPANLRNLDLQFTTAAVTVPTINLSGTLNVLAGGAITQAAGGVQVTGVTTLAAGGNAITLTDGANNFTGAVSANNTGANAIQLTDTNAIVLGTVNTANNLTVSAVGITQNAGGLTVGGTSLFNGGAGVITLTTAGNDFTGAVSANNTGANAIQLTDTNAIVLGTVNTADNLTVSAVGITQNAGGLTVGGTSLFNGGAGVITLTTATNDFTGAVSANNTGANAIQLTDTNAIVLGTVTTANNLTVSAVGITQNAGGLTVGGTSLFNGGAGVITLTTATNDFTGAVSLNNSGANNVAVADANAIVMGASTVGQNLAVTAKGSISQTGALVVPGTSSFTVDTALLQDVLLAGFDNNFTGAVTIATTGGATLQDVGLRNINGAAAVPALPANLRNLDLQFTTAAVTVPTINLSGTLNVLAGGAITQAAGGVKVTGVTTLASGANAITLTDGANDFTGAVSANNTGANAIQLTDTNAIVLGTVNTANNLTVSAVGITQNAGGLTVGGTSLFNGGAGVITLTTAGNNFTGAVSANNTGANAIQLTDTNAIVLGTVNTANNLTVSAVGITQNAGGLTVGGTSLFNGGAGVITLTTAGNNFTGAVSANNTGANAIQLTDTNAIVLGTVTTANNLTVSAVGITQNAGGLTVGGTSLFNGGAGVITLTTAGNDFTGAVSANNTGANAIQLTDTNAIVLGTVNTADNLTVNAVGITQNAGGLTVGGTSLFNGGAGVITLTTAGNNFTGAVSANNTGANAIQLTDTNTIVLGTVNTANNLTVSAVGITQNAGGLTVGGTSLFNAGAGVITLTTATNDFTGAVSLNNSGANNVAVADANAIVIGASTVGQNLAVTAKGSVSQTGALVVPGTSSFTVDTALLQDVLLAGFDNNFTGAVTIATTGGATLQDVGLRNINGAAAVPALPANLRNLDLQFTTAAVTVPTINLSGTLNVLAGGAITQAAGGVKVTGVTTLASGANAITLTDGANDFAGAVSANNTGANAIQLTDTNAIVLGTVTTADNLTVSAVGITQNAGGLTVGGTSLFNGGAGVITLTTAGNDFTGAVSANNTGANAIQLTDTNAIVLGTVNTANNLTVSAVGITQNAGGLTVGGTSLFNGGAGVITLTTAGNDFTGAVSANNTGANAIQLTDTNAIVLGTVTTANNLTVSAVGITQNAGGLTVGGTSLFNGGAGLITLTTATNDFAGAVSANNTGANAIQLTDTNAIVLGTVTTADNLTVNAVGITQNAGGLTVGGTSLFNGGAGVITLTTAGNNFTGAVSANNTGANAIQLTDTNAIVLGTVTTANNLTVNAVGITQNAGGLTVGGTSLFNGGAGVITLTTATNDFTGAVSANNTGANVIQLTDANAIVLGTVTTADNLTVNAVGITQNAGGLTVGGTTLFNGGAGVITLTTATNDFTGAVSANNTGANAIQLTDTNAIVLGTVNTADNLTVSAVGITQNAGGLTVGGTSLFNGGAGVITLTTAGNDFTGAVSANNTGANAIQLTDTNAIVLGTVTTANNLTVSAVGITQNAGGFTVGGTSLFNGGGGLITLTTATNDFAGAVSANNTGANAIQLTDTNAIVLGTVNTANNLTVSAVGITQNAGGLTVGGTSLFNGGAGVITLTTAGNNFTGAVSANNTGANAIQLTDTNAIVLGTVNTANNLTVSAVGITQNAGGLTVGGTSLFNGGAGAITLTTAGNDFTGAVSANNTGANAIQLTDTNAIVLGTVNTADNLTVSAVGITQNAGGLTVGGISLFNGGAGVITLTTATNDFTGAVSANNTGANAIQLTDTNAIVLGTVNTANNLTASAVGITQNAGGLTVGGTSLFNGGAGVITLTTAGNNFTGAVSANNTGANAIQLTDTNAIVLGTVNTANNLTVNAVGITQNAGGLTVGGTSLFNGGAGAITLTTAGNDFTGAVSANNTGANAIQLTDTNAIVLGTVNTADNLTVSAVGITQNAGGLTVGGISLFNGGAGVITLTIATNDFTGAVSANNTGANAIQLTDTNAIVLGTVNTANNLTVSAVGITQNAGGLTVGGTSLFNGGAGVISLTTATNDFTGAVSANNTGANAIQLTDTNAIVLGTVNTANNLTVSAVGISQNAGGLTVGGTSLFNGGAGVITLTTATNDFTGAVSANNTGANAIQLTDTNAIVLGTVTTANNLTVSAVGITQNAGGLTVGGASLFNGGAGVITLTTAGNDFTGAVSANNTGANAIQLTDTNAIVLGTVNTANNLTVSAVGITQNAGGLTVGGTSLLKGGAGAITLTTAGNDFTGAVSANNTGANAIQLTDTNAIVLGTVNTANNLTVSAVGITQNAGGLTVGGTSLFNGGAGVITLTTATNDFTGAVSANNTGANAIQLTDTNAIVLGTLNTANNLTVSAVGITQNAGGLTVGGTSLFNGGAGVITLTTAGNDFTGAVSANNTGANAIQLTDTNAIVLGTVNTANNLTVNAVGITQNAGGAITADTLILTTTNANTTLDTATNFVTNLGTVALGTGALRLLDAGGLTVTGAVGATGGVTLNTSGALAINNTVNAGGGNVSLTTTGAGNAITQNGTGVITADTLILTTTNASAALSTATNVVTNLGPVTLGTGALNLLDAGGLTVTGAVAATGGVSVNTSGTLAVNNTVNAGGSIVRVQTTAGDITQSAAITGGSLLANALAGSVSLGGATNNVATSVSGVAGGANGSFRFLNAGGVDVDTVTGDATPTTTANGIVANNGDVAILTGGTLTLNQPINAANGALNSAVSSGTVRLLTTAGDIIQTAAGPIVANGLLVNANGGVFLTAAAAANDVVTLAGRAGLAGFSYQDKNNVTVGNITADGAGLGPVLPIAGLNSINTTGPLTLTSAAVLNLSVPLILSGSLNAFGTMIDINGGGAVTVQTNGGQTYNNPVVLTADAVLVDTGSGTIRFASTVDSDAVTPRALTINTAGTTQFDGLVGNVPLLSVTTIAPGQVRFNAAGASDLTPSVRTTTSQTYNGAVRLAVDTVLSSTLGGNLNFNATVDSDGGPARILRVNSTGNEVFGGVVGGIFPLLNLVTDGDAAIGVGGQAQFNMAAPGGAIPAGVNAGFVTVNDTAFFNVGGSTTASPSVQTSGGAANAQTYNGAVLLNLGTVLNDTAGANVLFNSTVNGAFSLEANTSGNQVFNGVVGGTTPLTSLITDASNVGGFTVFNAAGTTGAPSVITTAWQTYNDDVTLGANVVLQSTSSGFITFNRTVNGAFALEANTGGNEVFNGRVGDTAPLVSMITDASNLGGNAVFNAAGTTGAPSVVTTGLQTYNDDVTLGANVVLQSTSSGFITFNRTVNGAFALEANTGGNEVFNGVVGGVTPLASLITDASNLGGNAVFNAAGTTGAPSVVTTGLQTYNDDVTLGANVVLQSTSSGFITFNRTVNGAFALEANTGGNEVFDGVVGGATPLASLITDASNLGGNAVFNAAGTTGAPSVVTTGLQTYNDDVTLGANVVLQSTGSGFITFNRTVNGAFALEANTGGNEVFNGVVGGVTPLASLITDASNLGGNAVFNAAGTTGAPSVVTTGLQTYNDDVTLGANVVLQSTGSGFITFNRTVNGAFALEANTGGNEVFNGVVGGTTPLVSLITDASNVGGFAVFNAAGTTGAPSVVTTGLQTYNDDVTLGANVVLQSTGAGNITFNRTVNGAFAVETNTAGNEVFNGVVGGTTPLTSLITDASNLGGNAVFNAAGTTVVPSVITTGLQKFNDDVTLGANLVLQSSGAGNITFNKTVNGAFALETNTGGNEVFNGVVGGTAPLTSLITDASNMGGNAVFNATGTTVAPSVVTTGLQTYNDDVMLGTNVVLQSTNNGVITFTKTVNGAFALEANTGGNEVFNGVVGGTTPLTSLITDASNPGGNAVFNAAGTTVAPSVVTTGLQTYNDDVTLGANVVLQSTNNGFITFNKTVNGAFALEANTGGNEVFNGVVGGTTPLTSLITDASNVGGNAVFNAAGTTAPTVTTTGLQTYNDAVTLAKDTVLTSDSDPVAPGIQGVAPGNNIVFTSTVDSGNAGPQSLTVNTGGTTRFEGDVGKNFRLSSVTTDNAPQADFGTSSSGAPSISGERVEFGRPVTTEPPTRPRINVLTTVAQTYGEPVVLNADVTLDSTTPGFSYDPTIKNTVKNTANVTLATTLDSSPARSATGDFSLPTASPMFPFTPRSVTINTGDLAFGGNVGKVLGDAADPTSVLRPANLTANATGTTSIGPAGVSGAKTVISVPAPLTFPNAVKINGNVTIETTGAKASLDNLVNLIRQKRAEIAAAKKTNPDPKDPLRIQLNADLATLNKDLKYFDLSFQGPITGVGTANLTLSSELKLSLDASVTNLGILNANVTPLKGVKSPGLITLGSAGDMLVQAGTVLFNPNGGKAGRDATILQLSGNLQIVADTFVMGYQQKLLVDQGRLRIDAQSATVGDLAASGGILVNADSVLFQGRPASGSVVANLVDQGLSIVGPTIDFGGAKLGFASTATVKKVFFATLPPAVPRLVPIDGADLLVDDKQGDQFRNEDANAEAKTRNGYRNFFFQPIASGVRGNNTQDSVVSFVLKAPTPIVLPEDTTISKADLETMKKMGLTPREATADENITVSLRQGVFTQPIEGKAEMENADYKVVLNRLTKGEIKRIVAAYLKLAGTDGKRIEEIAASLGTEVGNFHTAHPEVKGLDGFGEWLLTRRSADDKPAVKLAQDLDELAGVFANLSKVGLTKKEIEICKFKVLDDLKANLPDVEATDLLPLIEGRSKPPTPASPPGTPAPAPAPAPAESPLPPPPESAPPLETPKDAPKPDASAVPLPPVPPATPPAVPPPALPPPPSGNN